MKYAQNSLINWILVRTSPQSESEEEIEEVESPEAEPLSSSSESEESSHNTSHLSDTDNIDLQEFVNFSKGVFRSGYVIQQSEWDEFSSEQKSAVAFALTPFLVGKIQSFNFNSFAIETNLKADILEYALQHYLTKTQDFDVIFRLIDRCKAPINKKDTSGNYSLIYTITKQHSSVLVDKMLQSDVLITPDLIKKLSASVQDILRNERLHEQAEREMLKVLFYLIKHQLGKSSLAHELRSEWVECLKRVVAIAAKHQRITALSQVVNFINALRFVDYNTSTLECYLLPIEYQDILDGYRWVVINEGTFNPLSNAVKQEDFEVAKLLCSAGANVRKKIQPDKNILYSALCPPTCSAEMAWILLNTLKPKVKFHEVRTFASLHPEIYRQFDYAMFSGALLPNLNWSQKFNLIHITNVKGEYLIADKTRQQLVKNCFREYTVSNFLNKTPHMLFLDPESQEYIESKPPSSLLEFINDRLKVANKDCNDKRVEKIIKEKNIKIEDLPNSHPFKRICVLTQSVPNIPVKVFEKGKEFVFDFQELVKLVNDRNEIKNPNTREIINLKDVTPAIDYQALLDITIENFNNYNVNTHNVDDNSESVEERSFNISALDALLERGESSYTNEEGALHNSSSTNSLRFSSSINNLPPPPPPQSLAYSGRTSPHSDATVRPRSR